MPLYSPFSQLCNVLVNESTCALLGREVEVSPSNMLVTGGCCASEENPRRASRNVATVEIRSVDDG